jgi:hypothetical protein
MSEEEKPSRSSVEDVARRAHFFDLGLRVILGILVVIGAMSSLFVRAYGHLAFGPTLILAAIFTLILTQLPVLVTWGRQGFPLFRSIKPWQASLIAALLIAFVYLSEHLPPMLGNEASYSEIDARLDPSKKGQLRNKDRPAQYLRRSSS